MIARLRVRVRVQVQYFRTLVPSKIEYLLHVQGSPSGYDISIKDVIYTVGICKDARMSKQSERSTFL